MNRRRALRVAGAAAAALLLCGHTPYGQWVVYRKKHLLIGCHRADPPTYALARQVVETLAAHLPAAKARVARAPNAGRVASLLGTAQMDVAVLGPSDVSTMAEGTGRFAPYGPIAMGMLVPVGDRLLIARTAFPDRHAWLVTGALAGTDLAPAPLSQGTHGIDWHRGARAYLEGKPEPAATP